MKISSAFCLKDFQDKAKQQLKPSTFGYYVTGSDAQITIKNNILAFNSIRLIPRVLRDVQKVCLNSTFLGQNVKLPFGVAPFAMQRLIHDEGQLLTAQEAMQRQVPWTLSMLSTRGFSQVCKVNPNGIKLLQLYILKNAEYTQKVVKYAQKMGFKGIALTVDTQKFGKRRTQERFSFSPSVTLEVFKELDVDIRFRSLDDPSKSFVHSLDNKVSWEKVKFLKSIAKIPIILKGVASVQDALMAHQVGVDAIWLSNHGGRQLDTGPPTISTLKPIKDALKQIGSNMPVYIDGGIRKGSDIFKCLALGADYVFLGRGFLYSLIDGKEGVSRCFDILCDELKKTMQLCGVKNIQQINQNYVEVQPRYKL